MSKGFRTKILMKIFKQCIIAIVFDLSPTSSHFHPLLVVDGDDNDEFLINRVKPAQRSWNRNWNCRFQPQIEPTQKRGTFLCTVISNIYPLINRSPKRWLESVTFQLHSRILPYQVWPSDHWSDIDRQGGGGFVLIAHMCDIQESDGSRQLDRWRYIISASSYQIVCYRSACLTWLGKMHYRLLSSFVVTSLKRYYGHFSDLGVEIALGHRHVKNADFPG